MAQMGQISRHVFLSTYEDINAAPEEEPHKRSVFVADLVEQVEMNISTIIQVGHQLAVIGDEYNRRYSGKLEDPLFHLAKGIVTCVFQTRFWGKNVMKSVGSSLNSSWRKKIIDYVWACVGDSSLSFIHSQDVYFMERDFFYMEFRKMIEGMLGIL